VRSTSPSVRGRYSTALSEAAASRFWRQSVVLLLALSVLNASNYVFHVVVSRLLGPASYGSLASLLAVVLVLSVPFSVLQTVLAQRTAALAVAGGRDRAVELAADAVKGLTPVALLFGAIVALAAPAFAFFLHLGVVSALLLAPYVVLSMLASVPQGVLQGRLRFAALGAVMVGGVALRLGLGIGSVAAGAGVPGAVLATAVAPSVPLVAGLLLLRPQRDTWRAMRRSLASFRGEFAPAFLGLTGFWLLAEIDIALGRHYLPHEVAGFYSSAGLLARALLFLPAAVSLVAFPRFVAARETGLGDARWLDLSLLTVAVLCGAALPVLVFLRHFLVGLAFGARYHPAEHLLPILAPAMALFALVGLLVYFHIAMRTRAYVLLFVAAVVETALIALFHDSARELAWIVLAVAGATVVAQYAAAASVCRWKPLAELERLGPAPAATLQLSVVLPCHNAGADLAAVLSSLERGLDGVESYELIVVSDGSTDDTVAVAQAYESPAVRVLQYESRSGKGNALRLGLRHARGEYVAFLDADGDIEPDGISPFLTLMRLYEPDVVLGSKRHPLSEMYYPPLRRLLSWIYHKLTRILFRVNVRDTQTGFKLIRRDVLDAVLPRLLEKRYAFDLEFLVVARSLGFTRILEAPVRIHYRFASHVDLKAAYRVLLDTLAIFYRHYILDTYRSAKAPGSAAPSLDGALQARIAGKRRAQRRRRLRILFVNWRDSENPEAGGAEVFTHEVAKRWVAQGHDVTHLTSRFRGAAKTAQIDGVRVRRVGRLRSGTFHLLVQRELMRLRGFDLVVESVNTIPFLTPLWRRRLPPTVTLVYQLAVDVWDAELPRPLASLGRRLEHAMFRPYRNVPVVAISNSTREDLERVGLNNVTVITPGRDEPPEAAKSVVKEPVPTFLFVGRLAANKRPDHAVEAFRMIKRDLPDAQLWIVGRGPLEAELAESLPADASLLGRVSRSELYNRMARAHCLLVPSVREGWGLVVIESNSVGTPAVGYDVPGLRDSIGAGQTGELATASNPEGLAHAAVCLLADAPRYARTREAALNWAGHFSWHATAASLMATGLHTADAVMDGVPVTLAVETSR
jgi:glycosyltransferase involved in cell wall biosynthesis/O-antigen/teichoic acid export membrane protein